MQRLIVRLQNRMRHQIHTGSGKQIPLDLNLMAGPEIPSVLQAAYTRLELSRRLSFEQVMADRIYAIGVRNLAHAIVRRNARGLHAKDSIRDESSRRCKKETANAPQTLPRLAPVYHR